MLHRRERRGISTGNCGNLGNGFTRILNAAGGRTVDILFFLFFFFSARDTRGKGGEERGRSMLGLFTVLGNSASNEMCVTMKITAMS